MSQTSLDPPASKEKNEEKASKSIAVTQINDVIQFQEPNTSKSYSLKTEIRIDIVEQGETDKRAVENDDSVISLSLFTDENKTKTDPIEAEESYATMDACIKEKTTNTTGATIFSSNDRTQRMMVGRSEAPPPYESSAPPPYTTHRAYYAPSNRAPQYGYPDSYDRSLSPTDSDYMAAFIHLELRLAFIRKVFFLLALQLVLTAGFVFFAIHHEQTKNYIKTNVPMSWVMFMLWLVLYIVLMCYKIARQLFPLNFVLLLLFTIAMSYICAKISLVFSTKVVGMTLAGTGLICLIVTFLACQTWFDITKWAAIIGIASLILMVYGLVISVVFLFTYSPIMWLVYSALCTMMFTVFLLYDMQCILGGRRHEMAPDEYIFGALTLYVDIIMIFIYMLQLVNACSR